MDDFVRIDERELLEYSEDASYDRLVQTCRKTLRDKGLIEEDTPVIIFEQQDQDASMYYYPLYIIEQYKTYSKAAFVNVYILGLEKIYMSLLGVFEEGILWDYLQKCCDFPDDPAFILKTRKSRHNLYGNLMLYQRERVTLDHLERYVKVPIFLFEEDAHENSRKRQKQSYVDSSGAVARPEIFVGWWECSSGDLDLGNSAFYEFLLDYFGELYPDSKIKMNSTQEASPFTMQLAFCIIAHCLCDSNDRIETLFEREYDLCRRRVQRSGKTQQFFDYYSQARTLDDLCQMHEDTLRERFFGQLNKLEDHGAMLKPLKQHLSNLICIIENKRY